MASRNELEVTITSAKDLKNVNWRHGSLRPYAVVWVDPSIKFSTRVDEEGDTCPQWNQTLTIPLPGGSLHDHTLYIDIVHAGSEDGTKPLIGSARLPLRDVIDEVGLDERFRRSLQLKRPSGRPQGKLDVKVTIRDPRYRAPEPYYAPPYGVPPSAPSRNYSYGASPYGDAPPPPPNPYALPPSGYPSSLPPPNPYYATPPSGYPSSAPPQPAYVQGSYGYDNYGQQQQPPVYAEEKKKSKFGGMGTGLAVGAVAGALGGLAIAEGVDALEDHIAEEAAEKVEADIGFDDGGYGGDDF